MAQYIDKAAIVAEIEKRRTNIKEYCVRKGHDRKFDVVPEQLAQILSFINTLDVKEVDKEVDLEKEIESYFKGFGKFPSVGIADCIDIAKHFYELGIKAQKGE